uniref:Uncharacterized protein n=1 Tax=Anopheles merus TaxID=30066 RepID=A0A182VER6_ANOME
MAAARPDNGSKQSDTAPIQPMQRPKPPQQHHPAAAAPPPPSSPSSAVNRYPTILLNARKQAPRPAVPHVVRRLAPAVPRRGQLPSSASPMLITADSLRRTVYATLPSVSYHSAGPGNGLTTSTIVSFAGKQQPQQPQPATNELVSVVRPTLPPPPATIYKLVSASAATTGRKRMPQIAPKPPPLPPASQADPAPKGEQRPPTVATVRQRRPAPKATPPYNNAPGWRRILRNKVIVYIR